MFVNEFHYDNVGTDANEAIEVAAPAGTNFNSLSLYLYNGAIPGSGVVYNTTSLSGATIATVAAGSWQLAVMNYAPSSGIQNGNNDGIALVATCDDGTQQVRCGSMGCPLNICTGPVQPAPVLHQMPGRQHWIAVRSSRLVAWYSVHTMQCDLQSATDVRLAYRQCA